MNKLYVIRTFQKKQPVYLGYLSKSQARELTFSDHYPPEENRLGYQRPPDQKRAKTFASYINKEESGFLTPILLNARESIEFVEAGAENTGYLNLPSKPCLAIVDGQHRALGIINFLEQDVPIPFMLFDQLNTKMEQELFITINREQKRVNMSHVHFFESENDPLSRLVIILESDPESPWYHRINLVGARGTKRSVSLQSLRSSLEELLQSGLVKVLDFEQQYEVVVGYWRLVSKVWPDAWEATKGSLLTKSMGTMALSKLGGTLIPLCIKDNGKVDFEKLWGYISKAKEINWTSSGDFKGYSGHHAANLVKDKLDSLIFR